MQMTRTAAAITLVAPRHENKTSFTQRYISVKNNLLEGGTHEGLELSLLWSQQGKQYLSF